MIINEFTIDEIEYLVSKCNFSDDELKFFMLRTNPHRYTLEKISELMDISTSTCDRLSKKVKKKIFKVL